MEASRAESDGFISLGRLTPAEFFGCLAAALLVFSLFLPWFGTSMNENSELEIIGGGVANLGETATAWQTFPILRWLLVAAASAPFILLWIVARGHALTWKPGEVTMIVGITGFVLILCNGIILGKPGESVEISSPTATPSVWWHASVWRSAASCARRSTRPTASRPA